MAFPDRRTVNILCTILLFAVVLAIAYFARGVFVIFIFAILFAYLIDPVVRFLQRHSLIFKNLRGPHVAEAYLLLLILIPVTIHFLAPGSLGTTTRLAKQMPAFVASISTGEIATQIGGKYGWSDAQQQRLKSLLVEHQANIQSAARGWERSALSALGGLIVIPILALFFLSDGANMADALIRMVTPQDDLADFQSLAGELNSTLRHYIRAKVTLAALSLVFFSLATLLLRFPHSLALGLLAGILGYPRRRLDDFGRGDNQYRRDDARPLDLDGCPHRSLADAHGLWDFAARDGPRTRNPSVDGHLCGDGRRSGRRYRRHLPLRTLRCRASSIVARQSRGAGRAGFRVGGGRPFQRRQTSGSGFGAAASLCAVRKGCVAQRQPLPLRFPVCP